MFPYNFDLTGLNFKYSLPWFLCFSFLIFYTLQNSNQVQNSFCIPPRSVFLEPHICVFILFPQIFISNSSLMTLRLHLQCFSTPTLFIMPALFPKIRSRITSGPSLLAVACVRTVYYHWKIKPLSYNLALLLMCAFVGLKSLSSGLTWFRLLFSISMFPFLSHFLSLCCWVVWWKKYGSCFSSLIRFPSNCLLLPHLLLYSYLSHHISTNVKGILIFFDWKAKAKKLSLVLPCPRPTSESSQAFEVIPLFGPPELNNTLDI